MRLPFAPPSHPQTGTVIVFDIGSGSVAAAVAAVPGTEPARILSSKRIMLTNEDRTPEQLTAATMQALSDAGQAALDSFAAMPGEKRHKAPHAIHAMIHAPWVQAATFDSHITFDAPSRITSATIERAGKEAARPQPDPARPIFERMVVRVELNGYPTAEPVGKSAGDIRVVTLESAIDATFLKAAADAIGRLLPGHAPAFHSAIFAYTTVVRQLASHDSSFTFLDIGDEATAASVIRSGSIMQQGTAASGTRSLVRDAATAAGQTPDGVYSMVRMIAEGTCSDAGCDALAAALSAAEPAYLRSIGEVFSTMISGSRLPNQLVIAIAPDMLPWAQDFFERLDFGQFTLTGKPFAVEPLSGESLKRFAHAEGGTLDIGLGILGALVHIRYA